MMDEQSNPNRLADQLQHAIEDLEHALTEATTRSERRRLNQAIHLKTQLLDWCKTRAGFQLQPTAPADHEGAAA
jgi:hypothetical protein